MKILIVDDHSLFRAGLKLLLGQLADQVEVFEADSVDAGLAMGTQHPDVDLILLDLQLPGTHGLDGVVEFRRCFPASAVVLLTGSNAADVAAEGRAKGAQGFIAKAVSAEEMLDALRHVLDGELWFPKRVQFQPAIHLTPRQIEVLAGLCQGLSNKEIGRDLGMSENTVRSHVAVIFRELGAKSRTEAAMAARRHGLGG
jgi:two-component system nitrate/nitrite response regulator NarL